MTLGKFNVYIIWLEFQHFIAIV